MDHPEMPLLEHRLVLLYRLARIRRDLDDLLQFVGDLPWPEAVCRLVRFDLTYPLYLLYPDEPLRVTRTIEGTPTGRDSWCRRSPY